MGTPVESVAETRAGDRLTEAAVQLQAAAGARKCWACGCLRHALDAIDRVVTEPMTNSASSARREKDRCCATSNLLRSITSGAWWR